MNQIDTLNTHLQYEADRRVVLINVDDFRRPGDLAFLNIDTDIVVIVGELKRLHRWKGLQYPHAVIYRYFVREGELSTDMALAAQGVALTLESPNLKHLPWLVLSDNSDVVLGVLRINGIRRSKACTFKKAETQIATYCDVANAGPESQMVVTNLPLNTKHIAQPSQRTLGGHAGTLAKNSKYCYPDNLTEVGSTLHGIVEKEGGGFPISLVKLGRLVDLHASKLPMDVMNAVTAQRQKYRTETSAIKLLAKQNGLHTVGQQVLGKVEA